MNKGAKVSFSMNKGAKVTVCSHLERPEDGSEHKFSLLDRVLSAGESFSMRCFSSHLTALEMM